MKKSILAVLETERFPEEVAARAAWIARHYDADLDLVLSDPTIGFLRDSFMISADSQQLADTIKQAQTEELEYLVSTIDTTGLNVSTSIISDRPAADAIVDKALESEPLLVVKGTAYHSPAERATFTFTDWQLIRKLNFPLWLVKPQDWNDKPVVVAAVDPQHREDEKGELDQAIMDAAQAVIEKSNGKLLLFHTYERLEEIGSYAKLRFKPTKVPVDAIEAHMRDEHRRHLDSLAAKNAVDPEAIHMLPGRTRDILPSFVRSKNANLVVMGALARSGLKRRIIGSTAEHVIDHLHCDVLIARIPG